MLLEHTGSIIILSLAIFGLWTLLSNLWEWMLVCPKAAKSAVSVLLVVKDMEQEIEDILRYLSYVMQHTTLEMDVVIADYGSTDLTPEIIERLVDQNSDSVNYVNAELSLRPVADVIPYCRGEVIYVFDGVNRIHHSNLLPTIKRVIRDGSF